MWKLNKIYECLRQGYSRAKVQRIKKTLTIKEAAFAVFRKYKILRLWRKVWSIYITEAGVGYISSK